MIEVKARRRGIAAVALALLVAALQASCATTASSHAFRMGEKEMNARNYDRAVLLFSQAVSAKPDQTRYQVALLRARQRAAQDHFGKGQALQNAGQVEAAVGEFQQAVYLDPSHQYAANELVKSLTEWQASQKKQQPSEMERLKKKAKAAPGRSAPRLNPASNIPIVLRFKDEIIKKIYDALSKASGVNFIYDERLDMNKKITVDLADVTFGQALDNLMTMNKHFYKVWDENTILIADDNQQKHKEYDDLVIQTFFLSNADVKDVQVLLRTLLDARQLAQNDRLNAITIRDTPDRVQVAEKIIEANDKAKAELIIDIELLEVDRSILQNLGVDLFGIGGGTGKSLSLTYGGGTSVPLNNLNVLKQAGSWLLGPIPGVVVNFLKTDADAQVLAKPQLRVSEGEKATVRIGDRIPIPTTTFNAAPTVGGTVGVPITSFTYQNVGINIDLEPRVHHNKEITLKLKVEISSLAGTVAAGGGLTQPIIGTREIDTTIRLKDQETNMLAGLIREEERKSLSGVPGLSDIPVARRLFGNTETDIKQNDIVLTLTPHIIRVPDVTEEDLLPLWVGTESSVGLRGAKRTSAFGPSPFTGDDNEEVSTETKDPNVEEGTGFEDQEGIVPEEQEGAGSEDEGAAALGATVPTVYSSPASASAEAAAAAPAPTPVPTPAPVTTGGGAPPARQPAPQPAAGPALVTLEPSNLVVGVGQEFPVQIAIDSARGVGSVPFHLAYDPNMLTYLRSTNNSPFLSKDGKPVFVLATQGQNEVIVGLSRQGGGAGVDGSGTLVTLFFKAGTQPGATTINLTDMAVMDSTAQRLPFEKRGMSVSIH